MRARCAEGRACGRAGPQAIRDLGSNFFLTEADVGKPRAEVCAAKVCELNPNVTVTRPALVPSRRERMDATTLPQLLALP